MTKKQVNDIMTSKHLKDNGDTKNPNKNESHFENSSETSSLLSKMKIFEKYSTSPELFIGKLAVVMMFGLFAFLYLIALIFGCIFPLTEDSFESKKIGIIYLFLLHIFIIFPIITYIRVLKQDPGYINSTLLQKLNLNDLEESDLKDHASKATWCAKCKAPKPYRAHHCSVCNQCVLRMDHHCIFINKCVGEYNHKYFVSFLFWISFSCLVGLIAIPIRLSVHGDFNNWNGGLQIASNVLLLFCTLLTFYGFGAAFAFFCSHLRLYFRGTTTIENQFKKKYNVNAQPRKGKERFDWFNPF